MYSVNHFKVGERVELHPGLVPGMRGARYGTVVKLGWRYVHVSLEQPDGRIKRIHPFDLNSIKT